MVKLQQSKRPNDRIVNYINLPSSLIELLVWNKGDDLLIKEDKNTLIISKLS